MVQMAVCHASSLAWGEGGKELIGHHQTYREERRGREGKGERNDGGGRKVDEWMSE